MHTEKLEGNTSAEAAVLRRGMLCEDMEAHGIYTAECYGPSEDQREDYCALRDQAEYLRVRGYTQYARELDERLAAEFPMELKWKDVVNNLFTTVGKNDVLDKYFAGSAYTQTIIMGLKGTGTAVIGDTQASHAGWLEQGLANAPTYTGNRKVPAFSAASAGSKATSAAVSFAITSTGTVYGCFLNNGGSTTIDNTTGVLVSAGDFTGGSKAVANGDTLNVTYTASV